MTKRILLWLKNLLLRLLSIPAYILLGISLLFIVLLEIGQTDSVVTSIIKEVWKKK